MSRIMYKKPKVALIHATPLAVGECAARACYNSFSMSENESVRNFEQTLAVESIPSAELLKELTWSYQHESVNEHINLSFYVQDVSREVVIEWNRHRLGMATSQQSSRYTMEDVINAWIDYRDNPITKLWETFLAIIRISTIDENPEMIAASALYIASKLTVYNADEPLIKNLKGSKKKKQNDRVKRCLPEVWMLKGMWTFNLRALKHFIKLRNAGSAYYGIREVAQAILEQIPTEYLPLIVKSK